MTLVSLSLITFWLTLLVLGVSCAGLVHLLPVAAVAIVFLSGNRAHRLRGFAGARVARIPDAAPRY